MKTKTVKKKEEKVVSKPNAESLALNAIMASSVEKAYNMAVDNGASIANPTSSATKVANVESLPKIQLIGESLASEAYKSYKSRPIVVQARKLSQPELIESQFGMIRGEPGQYRVINEGKHSFVSANVFEKEFVVI